MRLVCEQCSIIHISTLQSTIRKIIRRDNPKASEEEVFNFTQEELNKFRVNDQDFGYLYLKNKLGGYRWFFICEKCEQKALKLFLPPEGFIDYEHKYYCKRCHNLFNECAVRANNSLYKKVIRPLKKLREIEKKLERGHLQEKNMEDLLNEYDKIEQEMKNCPEYRLYAFRKKRGMKLL